MPETLGNYIYEEWQLRQNNPSLMRIRGPRATATSREGTAPTHVSKYWLWIATVSPEVVVICSCLKLSTQTVESPSQSLGEERGWGCLRSASSLLRCPLPGSERDRLRRGGLPGHTCQSCIIRFTASLGKWHWGWKEGLWTWATVLHTLSEPVVLVLVLAASV